jgi:hypothetical protein
MRRTGKWRWLCWGEVWFRGLGLGVEGKALAGLALGWSTCRQNLLQVGQSVAAPFTRCI